MNSTDLPFDLFSDVLRLAPGQVAYAMGRALTALRPSHAVVATDSSSFDIEDAVRDGAVVGSLRTRLYPQVVHRYVEGDDAITRRAENAVYDVTFEDESIEVVVATYPLGDSTDVRSFVIAVDEALALRFVEHVCRYAAEVRGEVLVFEGGSWRKDEKLFQAIQRADMSALILRGALKADVVDDVVGFFSSKAVYDRYRVPHKRGMLLYGPPGNGKTHFIKALLKQVARPCLYVKSVEGSYRGDHEALRRIFARARRAAPCVLVLEDLETILKDDNRSFFLNELDGFSDNSGILTLATTNYPERIDPAIIDRPSRFDRKYFFDSPREPERRTYLAHWSSLLEPALQLDEAALTSIAGLTGGFSFAYLKELTLSATMAWIREAKPGSMADVMTSVLVTLGEQAKRGKSPGRSESRRMGLVPEA